MPLPLDSVCNIVPAEDTSQVRTEALSMEAKLAIARLPDNKTGKLLDLIQMAIGMKAMEAEIANGTRSKIQDIILDK